MKYLWIVEEFSCGHWEVESYHQSRSSAREMAYVLRAIYKQEVRVVKYVREA